jgi:DNA (cytosine-5)-methyltransferase 3A
VNVLSLFDGISCGQIALRRLGVEIDQYFASEIDEYAIKVTQKHYPETVQLGDVVKIKGENLPEIDLLMGGSPCQGFSIAGKRLNFDDERSKLFFEFVRLLKETKPKYFLLENVKMKQEYQDIISYYLGVLPIEINSSLVSAQNRKRLYWTNISNVTQPLDRNIYIEDVVDKDAESLILHNIYGGFKETEPRVFMGKSPTLRTAAGGGHIPSIVRKGRMSNYSITDKDSWRKIVPRECERLQTIPEDYTMGFSDTQRYKMIGNGWTVDVICHILSYMETN